MRLFLRYAAQLRKLSGLLVAEFEQLVERINAWARAEHHGDGTHGDITVTAIQWLGDTQTTVGSAGAATALPASPTGYLVLSLSDDTEVVVPYYTKA